MALCLIGHQAGRLFQGRMQFAKDRGDAMLIKEQQVTRQQARLRPWQVARPRDRFRDLGANSQQGATGMSWYI